MAMLLFHNQVSLPSIEETVSMGEDMRMMQNLAGSHRTFHRRTEETGNLVQYIDPTQWTSGTRANLLHRQSIRGIRDSRCVGSNEAGIVEAASTLPGMRSCL